MSNLIFPNHIDPASFLDAYWQRKHLFMPSALPGFRSPIDPDELAGLACEEEIESRLVLEKGGSSPWEARCGPFDESEFGKLPESHWTLLVQDVDKHLPEVAELLKPFRFIPDWRLDDIMISYAADGGSVGPHIDDYDVFLIQAWGKRRWSISEKPYTEDDYVPGLDLRILPEFRKDAEWLTEPGDMLYLPPNLAHWGVAEGECMTISVGFRSPRVRDVLMNGVMNAADNIFSAERYRDPGRRITDSPGEIRTEMADRLKADLAALAAATEQRMETDFGCYVTEQKPNLQAYPLEQAVSADQLADLIAEQGHLVRNGYSRLAFSCWNGQTPHLFANGRHYPADHVPPAFLKLITEQSEIAAETIQSWLSQQPCRDLLTALVNDGHLLLADE